MGVSLIVILLLTGVWPWVPTVLEGAWPRVPTVLESAWPWVPTVLEAASVLIQGGKGIHIQRT